MPRLSHAAKVKLARSLMTESELRINDAKKALGHRISIWDSEAWLRRKARISRQVAKREHRDLLETAV